MIFKDIIPAGFDAALITSDQNRRYLTGVHWDDGYFIATRERFFVCADGRCFEAVEKSAVNYSPVLINSYKGFLTEFLTAQNLSRIVCEGSISVNKLKIFNGNDKGISFNTSDEFDTALLKIRRTKSNSEMQKIKAAQQIAESALTKTLSYFKAGMTEIEFAARLEYEMRKLGSEGTAFDTIAISGKKTSVPHGMPSNKAIEKGDFLTVDFGAMFDGYRSDMTRTFAVGSVSADMEKIYDIVLKAQKMCIDNITVGMTCKQADSLSRDIIANAGYGDYFTHSTGHGVGLDIHEAPNLSPLSKEIVSIGDIVTVEPGIYLKDHFGVRIEDMLYISQNGIIDLTEYPKNLTVI